MLTSLDDLVLSGFPSPPMVLDATELRPDLQTAGALGLDDDAHALRIRVVRRIEGAPYAYSIIHIPEALARNLPTGWQTRTRDRSLRQSGRQRQCPVRCTRPFRLPEPLPPGERPPPCWR